MNARYGITLIFLMVAVACCSAWLSFEHEQSELDSFLHSNPWAWIKPSLGWAEPDVHSTGPDKRIENWAFDLDYPAGLAEVVIIPQHRELCVFHDHTQRTCTPLDDAFVTMDSAWDKEHAK